ncbi:MAG: SH3 domain-containing protein [Chloroflexi bacterium]|nr:SH3 domain-containing protein [Chloroflexota bacterium]
MTRALSAGSQLAILLAVVALGLAPVVPWPTASGVFAQEISVDPRGASPTAADLRPGFQLVPDKSEQREPLPGILVYEADFTRDQTPQNFKSGPIEIKSLVARTASSQQAAEQFASSRQALVTASPPWVEKTVSKMGDESTGLTMEGTSAEGPAVAHLYLFRRGAMVVGITVAGLTKPTTMAEAESIAAMVLKRIDPTTMSQTGPRVQRPLNSRPASNATGAATSNSSSTTAGTGQKVRVANTDGTGVRLRTQPSKTAAVATVVPEGTTLDVVGQDKQADGLTWRNVRVPGDGSGWIASDYLVAAPSSGGGTSSSASPSTGSANADGGSGSNQTAAAPAASPTPQSGSSSSNGSRNRGVSATATPTNGGSSSASPSASPNTASTSASGSSTSSPSAPANPDVLVVDVSVTSVSLKSGSPQTLSITVTRDGQPVKNAKLTVKTTAGDNDESLNAPDTDESGTSSVTWTPKGTGSVGVGVSAIGPDGTLGAGGGFFQIS